MPSSLISGAVPFGKATRIYLKYAPLCGGEAQIRHASRVSLDGHGGLVLWDTPERQNERLSLDRVCILQLLVVDHTQPTTPHLHTT